MRVCARVCKRERLNLCVKRKERDSVCTPLRNVKERERERENKQKKKPRNGGKKKKRKEFRRASAKRFFCELAMRRCSSTYYARVRL